MIETTGTYRGRKSGGKEVKGCYCEVGGKHYIIKEDAKILRRTISDFNTVFGDVIAGFVEVDPETVSRFICTDRNGKEVWSDSKVFCCGVKCKIIASFGNWVWLYADKPARGWIDNIKYIELLEETKE